MRISYTTYDVRREDDVLRLKAEPNVMVMEDRLGWNATDSSNAPPYRYAQVLGIFHADVRFVGSLSDGRRDYTPHRIDFLWVRWYLSLGYPTQESLELERLKPVPLGSPDAIGFLSPRQVIRAVHLIPDFTSQSRPGMSPQLISPWLGTRPSWSAYYLNRSVHVLALVIRLL
jgi:hypothetical protein